MLSLPLQQQKLFLRDIRLNLYIALGIIAGLVFISLGLTWFGTNAQIGISTTLTYAGRERSLTQKILAESLQTVYVHDKKAMKNLKIDEDDWTARHDAIWRGDNTLHVLSVSTFSDIQPSINAVEPQYLALHIAVDGVLSEKNPTILQNDAAIITRNATPFYNAMEAYNTYLRNLTARYQTSILVYSVCSTIAILLVLLFSALVVFRSAFRKLSANVVVIEQANSDLQKQKREMEILLEEIRRTDHNTRAPVVRLGVGEYAVQNGTSGYYNISKVAGLLTCPCPIFVHNRYCNHVKAVQEAERTTSQVLSNAKDLSIRRP